MGDFVDPQSQVRVSEFTAVKPMMLSDHHHAVAHSSGTPPSQQPDSMHDPHHEQHAFTSTPTSPSNLDANFKRKSSQQKQIFLCDYEGCGKTFTSSNGLKYHRRTHTGDRLFVCDVEDCQRSYSTKSNLTEHLRTHTGERPFSCTVEGCHKTFSSANGLKYHRRTHTGEHLYRCTFEGCSKCYTTENNLKEHSRVHTGEKPFVCSLPTCNKCFTTANGLKYHMRMHTGEKLFACDVPGCEKTYSTNSNLMEHKRNIHEMHGRRGHRTKQQDQVFTSHPNAQPPMADSDDTGANNHSSKPIQTASSVTSSSTGRPVLSEAQIIPLVEALASIETPDLNKANAATEIWRLVEDYTSPELNARQLALTHHGAIDALLTFIVSCDINNYRYRAFGAISNLCYRNTEVSHKIGCSPLLIPACTKALESSDESLKMEALRALNNIAFYSIESHPNILPVVPLIVATLDEADQSKEIRFMCCNVLENLPLNEQSRSVLLPSVHPIFKAPTTLPDQPIPSSPLTSDLTHTLGTGSGTSPNVSVADELKPAASLVMQSPQPFGHPTDHSTPSHVDDHAAKRRRTSTESDVVEDMDFSMHPHHHLHLLVPNPVDPDSEPHQLEHALQGLPQAHHHAPPPDSVIDPVVVDPLLDTQGHEPHL